MRRTIALIAAGTLLYAAPAQAESVACYEEVQLPAVHGVVEELAPLGAARRHVVPVQGQYAMVVDNIPVASGFVEHRRVPPTYGTMARTIVRQPSRAVTRTVPAVTQTVQETVVLEPAHEIWEWRIVDGRKVRCRIVVPARTAVRTRTIVVEPERRWTEIVPAVTELRMEQVVVAPGGIVTRSAPPVYRSASRIVEMTPPGEIVQMQEREYGLVKRRGVTREAGPGLRRVRTPGC